MRFVVEMAGTAVTSRASATSLSPRTGRDTVCCSDRRRAPVRVNVTSCRSTNANPLPTPTRIPTTGGYVTLASQRTTRSPTLPTRLPAASRTRRPSRWANEIVWAAIVRRAAIRSCKAADTAPRRGGLRLSGAANVASPRFSDAPEMRAQNAPTVPAILPARARRGGCFGGNADAIRPTPSEILSRLWIEAGDGLTCRSAFDAPPQRPPVVRSLRPALQLGAQRRIGGVRPADR